MGCDIHLVKEKIIDGEWVAVWASGYDVSDGTKVSWRNYPVFTELASVRGESETALKPKGLPDDIAEGTKAIFEDYGGGHSASYLSAKEFVDAYDRAYNGHPFWEKWYRPDHAVYDVLGIWSSEADDYRIVFWFDN